MREPIGVGDGVYTASMYHGLPLDDILLLGEGDQYRCCTVDVAGAGRWSNRINGGRKRRSPCRSDWGGMGVGSTLEIYDRENEEEKSRMASSSMRDWVDVPFE